MQEKKHLFHLKWTIEDSIPAPSFSFIVFVYHAKKSA